MPNYKVISSPIEFWFERVKTLLTDCPYFRFPGSAEFEFRNVKFLTADILIALVGNPDFHVSVWRFTTQEQLSVVKSPLVTSVSSLEVT